MMQYRRLGRTNLLVSAVGFGTCQLRRVPEQQAIDTLKRGFELGVNLVHTAPDYEGADDLVAQAIKESRRPVFVLSQGYGDVAHCEWLFESACRRSKTRRLEMFGIACIDDREFLGEPVRGPGGLLEFLEKKKAQGRLGGIFCTTHGTPEYIAGLVTSGRFDAIMLAYNVLGFHLLSYHPSAPRMVEDIPRNKSLIFPLAAAHDVGLLVMKPLAGGLLCPSKSFPPRARFSPTFGELAAGEILRDILEHPEIASVVPGTASVEEAEENARAGHAPKPLAPERRRALAAVLDVAKRTVCSRCGDCDSLCSQRLPVSWLFRDAYINHYPAETFETIDQHRYFSLHPADTAVCSTCPNVTCACPNGIDIPASLIVAHTEMMARRAEGVLPEGTAVLGSHPSAEVFAAHVVMREIPQRLSAGQPMCGGVWVQNVGAETWKAPRPNEGTAGIELDVYMSSALVTSVPLRHDVEPGTRTHFAFMIDAPDSSGSAELQLLLRAPRSPSTMWSTLTLLETELTASEGRATPTPAAEVPEYGVDYLDHDIPVRLRRGSVIGVHVQLRNTGRKTWHTQHPEGRCVDLVVMCDEEVWATHHLPHSQVLAGERITIPFTLRVPDAPGRHTLKIDLVEQGVTWFEQQGTKTLIVTFDVDMVPASPSEVLYADASALSPWHYQATAGIHRGLSGETYPLFASRADGCHLWDLEGRRYIDYIMGWGSALLGYNEPRIRNAIIAAMDCAPVVPFPHRLEIDVSRMLVEDVPSAEMVMFGKNGSDVCTLAARVARVFTGRTKILFSGYHGWGDWWVEQAGFAATGVPDRRVPLIHPFRFNDLADFTRLFELHRDDLAAVMLEPAGPAEAGRLREDADANFLAAIATMTRDAGALLIYDEIMTGFRYPGGSAQHATGVVPDLTCLGKALAAGMPLSALVGRARILTRAMANTHYGPTYRGEVYSLAAARAALEIYRHESVAEHVWHYGEKLRQGVDQVCASVSVAARMAGPPFRMGLRFDEPDPLRAALQRTLYFQELLRAGILTYDGVMLPSYAHNDSALAETLSAIGRALERVARAIRDDTLDRLVEIPLR